MWFLQLPVDFIMNYFFLPVAGLLVGMLGALGGFGGGFMVVPFLLWLGFSKEAAVSTSFLNMSFLVAASLALYGFKGAVDWRAGILLGCGAVIGALISSNYIQPHINEKHFRYFLFVVLILAAMSLLFKK